LQKTIETVMPSEERGVAQMRRREAAADDRAEEAQVRAQARAEAKEAAQRRRPVARFDFMVAGVQHEGRGAAVRNHCRADDFVELVRERGNRYSRNAILVRLQTGEDIGYVPEFEAERLARFLDDGSLQSASVKKILSGRRAPIPVVWGELYGQDSGVSHARTTVRPVEAAPPMRQGWAWLALVAAGVAIAVALLR
jgi:hypothetical protein